MGQEIMGIHSTKDSCSKSTPSLSPAEQLLRLVPSIAPSLSFSPASSRRVCSLYSVIWVQKQLFLPWLPHREDETGAGRERRQIRCLLSQALPLASSITLVLYSVLLERQGLASTESFACVQ